MAFWVSHLIQSMVKVWLVEGSILCYVSGTKNLPLEEYSAAEWEGKVLTGSLFWKSSCLAFGEIKQRGFDINGREN